MANVGFEVINDNNVLLINQDYMNLAFTRKVQVSTLPYWFSDVAPGYMIEGSNYSCRKITLKGNENVAFLGGINGNGSIDGFAIDDYWAAFNKERGYYIFLRNGVDASKLYMYVFGKYINNPDSIRYGLKVFDESSNLLFSSNIKPLKVLHHANYNDDYTVDSTKTVAINVANVAFELPYSDLGTTPLYVDGHSFADPVPRDILMPYMARRFYSSAPAIINGRIQRRDFDNGPCGSTTVIQWNGFIYTIIDVTNY